MEGQVFARSLPPRRYKDSKTILRHELSSLRLQNISTVSILLGGSRSSFKTFKPASKRQQMSIRGRKAMSSVNVKWTPACILDGRRSSIHGSNDAATKSRAGSHRPLS